MKVIVRACVIAATMVLSTVPVHPSYTSYKEPPPSVPIIEDFHLLCQLVEEEAGNQTITARQKVAEVVLNRADFYGMTIRDTIYAGTVFKTVPTLSTSTPSENTILSVKIALGNDDRVDALWFCDDSEKDFQKYFSQPIEMVEKHDNMEFWRIQ